MIGDYIDISGHGNPIELGIVQEVSDVRNEITIGLKDCSGIFAGNEISPIPLTPEILEKNGWKETAYWHEYQDGKNIIQCCLPDMRGKINGIEIEHFKCEYVHQYQHLLHLCGLDELADNFKI